MRSKVWLHLIKVFFLLTASLCAHASLLFTESEVRLIQQNTAPQTKLNRGTSKSEELYLSAIVYVDKSHWSLCLNNRIIRSDRSHQIDDFHIEDVSPLRVKFSWVPPNSAQPITFTLRPYQIFLPNENRVMSK